MAYNSNNLPQNGGNATRILIVDSDEAFLEVLQCYMWKRGHVTEIATNGLECMAALRYFKPEVLVLTDELLWGGSEEVLALMGEDPEVAPTPTILISDEDPERSLPPMLHRRIFKSLRKLFRLSDLKACIDAAGRSPRREVVPQCATVGVYR